MNWDQKRVETVHKLFLGLALLKPFLKDANNERAGKAAYQLAIVYEAQGRVEKAIKMVQIAIDKYKSNYALNLLEELKTE